MHLSKQELIDSLGISMERAVARGIYSTVASEHRHAMEKMQSLSQEAVDAIRQGLLHQENIHFDAARDFLRETMELSDRVKALTEQKEMLYPAAWGEESSDPFEEPDPI